MGGLPSLNVEWLSATTNGHVVCSLGLQCFFGRHPSSVGSLRNMPSRNASWGDAQFLRFRSLLMIPFHLYNVLSPNIPLISIVIKICSQRGHEIEGSQHRIRSFVSSRRQSDLQAPPSASPAGPRPSRTDSYSSAVSCQVPHATTRSHAPSA